VGYPPRIQPRSPPFKTDTAVKPLVRSASAARTLETSFGQTQYITIGCSRGNVATTRATSSVAALMAPGIM
jgi:hypothetical protein